MTTPRLGAPELAASQAVPETTVNEIARYLEQGAMHFKFKDRNLAAPPGAPADGDCYLVAAGGSGAWAGHDGDIAFRLGSAWAFIEPVEGMAAWIDDENAFVIFDGAAWSAVGGSTTIQFPVEEDGVEESATVERLNFTGNVDVSVVGGEATVNVPTPTNDGADGLEGSESVLRFQYGNGSGSTTTQVGFTVSNQGTAGAPGISTTNRLTRASRSTRATTSAAGTEAGLRSSQQIAFRDVGFTYEFRGGIETLVADARLFIGLRGSSAFFGNADPSAATNIIGFACDTADANIQLMHNDGAGVATKVDTGIAKTAGDEIYVRIHCDPGGDFEVLLKQFAGANLTSTPTAMYPVSGTPATISADIPAVGQALAFLHWINNGATASAAVIAMIRESLRSPF